MPHAVLNIKNQMHPISVDINVMTIATIASAINVNSDYLVTKYILRI